MLAKFANDPFVIKEIKIYAKKRVNGENASIYGSFPLRSFLTLSLYVPRALGTTFPILRIAPDGAGEKQIPMEYEDSEEGFDIYSVGFPLKDLCGDEKSGLFYYDFLFPCGDERTYFSGTHDNLHIYLSEHESEKFRLLVYEDSFETPKWFHGGVIYHIFVDRFARGSFIPPLRDDAEMNEDWENGIPQYGEYEGAFVKNNMFFGGNLVGIREKLGYLASLGITVIYLSPIFKAYSNHKYDTGDYMKVDPMFGGEKALSDLIKDAKKYGIRIILDGVFNHTGDDSIYFNKYGKYQSVGAYQSKESEYFDWFTFTSFPDKYDSWWGIPILPKLNLSCETCRDFLAGDTAQSVIGKYTEMGLGGWRIDVADELSDDFLDRLAKTAKHISEGNAVIIGEVWENAADKISYGKRRRYLRGGQLDSVMNYPFRNAVIDYLLYKNAEKLADTLTELYASYPKSVSDSLMNILGTHDTERILTVLGEENKYTLPNEELAHIRMSDGSRASAVRLLKLASVIQYTVYGVPSVFYGDEAGIEGYHDPFCRMPFPWGREIEELTEHYRLLGKLRASEDIFADGDFEIMKADASFLLYRRKKADISVLVAVNAGGKTVSPELCGKELLTKSEITKENELPPYSAWILKTQGE